MKEVFEKAILTYGQTAQEDVAIEEMSELIKSWGLLYFFNLLHSKKISLLFVVVGSVNIFCLSVLCGDFGFFFLPAPQITYKSTFFSALYLISHLAPLCVCMDGEFSPFADNGFGLIFRIKFSRDCRVGDDLKICHASHPPCILCGRYGKIQTRATAFVWVCLWVSS